MGCIAGTTIRMGWDGGASHSMKIPGTSVLMGLKTLVKSMIAAVEHSSSSSRSWSSILVCNLLPTMIMNVMEVKLRLLHSFGLARSAITIIDDGTAVLLS